MNEIYSSEVDVHLHCIYCYRRDCSYKECVIISCSECKTLLHCCKLEDHLLICPKVCAPCINASFGCPLFLRRERMMHHLKHCCASVVFCAVQWNRRTISNYAKRKLKRLAKGLDEWKERPKIDEREVDLCAALADQVKSSVIGLSKPEVLVDSYQLSRKDRKRMTDFQNPCHPLMPLRLQMAKQESFIDEDSSDEENKQKEIELKKKTSPFEHCYLCKADPASQHLHVLGNINFESNEEMEEEKKEMKISVLPTFYDSRSLYLNLVCDHLSAFACKGENMACTQSGIAVYTFCCNENFRRDEYCDHYKLSHMDTDDYIKRCPMYIDGCPYYYANVRPAWGELRYSRYLNCLVHRPPSATSRKSRKISLCDLPPTVLYEMMQYLDSCSLRCLSSTNTRMRHLCFQIISDRAMVYIKWEQSETSHNWSEKCFVWEFSKCQGRIHEWTDKPAILISSHLAKCSFNKPEVYESDRVPLPALRSAFNSTVRPLRGRIEQVARLLRS